MWILEVVTFSFAWWLGLYLARRQSDDVAARWTAAGLLAYSLALAVNSLLAFGLPNGATLFVSLLVLPFGCWVAALWHLRPKLGSIPARWQTADSPQSAVGLILVATVTFALGTGLLLVPLGFIPRPLLIVAVGLDLLILGYAVSVLDAFEQGETLLPDIKRSFLESEVLSGLFGSQIVAAMILSTGVTLGNLLLLYVVVATSTTIAVFSIQIQRVFDRVVFGADAAILQERTALRGMSEALPRIDSAEFSLDTIDFPKVVRRALSNMGNMPKLATSPLVQLPLVDARLLEKGLDDTILHRSAELKGVLAEAIDKLKPSSERDFDSTDAWRHYNALYFPYVRGLRPYSRRADHYGLAPSDREALSWLQREIPQRTLYNWQNAAAKVISADLQEQLAAMRSK